MSKFKGFLKGAFSKKPLLFVGGAIVAAVALGLAVRYGGSAGATPDRATYEVQRGDLEITLHDTGDLQAQDSIKIQPEVDGELTIVQLVDEGVKVKKGDFLVKFDSTDLERQVTDGEIDLQNSAANLVRTQEQKKIQELTNDTNILNKKLTLESARKERDKYGIVTLRADGMLNTDSYLITETVEVFGIPGAPAELLSSDSYLTLGPPTKGEAYQAFRDAELEIARAQTALERAVSNFDKMDELVAKGFSTRNEYITDELNVLEARRNLESSYLKHYILRTYTYPKTLSEKEAALKQAQDQFKQTEIQAKSDMTQKDNDIKEAQNTYEMKKTNLGKQKDKLTKMTITAPDDGLALYGDAARPWDKDQVKVGGKVWRGFVIITIPKVSNMIAATKVMERNVNKVKVDQKALVTLPALPGVKLAGKVSKVSSVASASGRWWSPSDVKTFDLEVKLEESHPLMKPGMSCEVDIFVDTIKDVLYVPVNAVFREGGKDVCYVVSSPKTTPVTVTLGQTSDLYTEVKEGLKEGQKVLLYSSSGPGQAEAAGEKAKPGKEAKPGEGKNGGAKKEEAKKEEPKKDEAKKVEAKKDDVKKDEAKKDDTKKDDAKKDEVKKDETKKDDAKNTGAKDAGAKTDAGKTGEAKSGEVKGGS